jgi:hypothetical protein
MIYYIAGPISNCLKTYHKSFHDVAQPLRDAGHSVLDPSMLPPGLSQGQYMQICLPMVSVADELIMLTGWEQSEGAYIEFMLAKKSGKMIRDVDGLVLHDGDC